MIAVIDMRGIARLVLAAQDVGDDRSETPEHQSVGIDQMPLLLHLGRLGLLGGLHQRLHGADLLLNDSRRPFWSGAEGGQMAGRCREVQDSAGLARGSMIPQALKGRFAGERASAALKCYRGYTLKREVRESRGGCAPHLHSRGSRHLKTPE